MIELTQAINTVWVVMAGALVFLMHLGFTLLEAGFTRMKNAANIAAKNVMNIAVGMLAFWAVGFAFMFGDGNNFIGHAGWFLPVANPPDVFSSLDWAGIPISALWFFQVVFAATAATIVSGAMAERTRFRGYVIYVIALTAFIYPVVGHWAWGGGWLGDLGFIDFAGSTVVHTVGGTAAFVGAAVVGPRIGKYEGRWAGYWQTITSGPRAGETEWRVNSQSFNLQILRTNIIPGHSMPLAIAGVIVLWFGWFGFNAGSTLAAIGVDFASIILTTNLAAAAGVMGVLLMLWMLRRKPDVGMMGNGALAGLVAITAGCAFVETTGALTIGFIAGAIVVTSALFIDRLRVDDPVGAISVHAVCGIWGTLAVGLYATGTGLFYGHGWSQLGIQAVGVVSVVAWTGLTCFVVFYAIKKTVGLRVSKEEELEGLDIAEHGVSGYTAID